MDVFSMESVGKWAALPETVKCREIPEDTLAALLQTEAESQGAKHIEWECRVLQEHGDSPLKTELLGLIAESLGVRL